MKINRLFICLSVSLVLLSCNNQPKKTATGTTENQTTTMNTQPLFDPAALGEEPVLNIETSEGVITVKLYKDTPLHRDNFVKLASEGYFDGLIFHRVIKGFMIQGGDPDSRNPKPGARYGMGGPDYKIPAEILPQYKHKKGALAAARQSDAVNPEKKSSGSQFYIVENPASCAQLDGGYTVFGETLSGLEVVDKIAATKTGANDRPEKDIFIVSIRPAK